MFKIAFFTHYQTTLAGLAGIFAALAKIASTGHVDVGDVTAIVTGVGLLFAAVPQKAAQ